MGRTHARRPRRALAASAVFGMVAGSLATMGSAHAAVMLSGSAIDAAGNYVDGYVYVYDATSGSIVDYGYAQGGAFDIALEDGTYKIEFLPGTNEFASEYYRDKASFATADVVTVSGAAQTLPAWTIDRQPNVSGVVRTADGRPVRNATVRAYDATSGTSLGSDTADRLGAFRIGTTAAAVKLEISGEHPVTGDDLATEWFNDKPSLATADPVTPTAAGADVGVITLAAGGSIAGRITNEFGSPLHRARACSLSGGCDYTDPNGYYLIEGAQTGEHTVRFTDPIGEYVGEYWNDVPLSSPGSATVVTVAPGQAVTNVDAALTAEPVVAPNGVDVSGTVRDQLGGVGVGYEIEVYDTPADPRDAKVVATTVSNRLGQYHFAQLDRVGGETEFKLRVAGDDPREDGDFARRSIWSGDAYGYETATAISAAARTLDFVQPVAGGVSGTVTSEAGGVPDWAYVLLHNADGDYGAATSEIEVDGSYDTRTVWPGTYKVQFAGADHVTEWWKDARFEDATTITVQPGQMVAGLSAVLAKDARAIDRPQVTGDAWVGKTLTLDKGRWNTEAGSRFAYEWLVGSTVVGTGPTLTLTAAHLGKQVVGRVTNDAGFTVGQAVSAATLEVGYRPTLKTQVAGKKISLILKAKPVKRKKVKATVVAYLVKGENAAGEPKLKKLGKAKIKKGEGVVTMKKPLTKGKHTLVFRIAGKGKVGSGDLVEKIKIKR